MAGRNLSRIRQGDIKLGEPLRYSAYDAHGVLLLRRGVVVSIPAQIDRLIAEGLYLDQDEVTADSHPAAQAKVPVFLRAESFCHRLQNLMVQVVREPEQANLARRASDLAHEIQAACAENADSLLAALQIDHTTMPLVLHQVFGAVLAELVGRQAGASDDERRSLVCAALTRDLGQTAYQHDLDRIAGPLPDTIRGKLRTHPGRSAELIRRAQVADGSWLNAVETHHERLDGSGYPGGQAGEQIAAGARLLAVCDSYSAMVKPRPHRPRGEAIHTQVALRQIFADRGRTMDGSFAGMLVKAIGVLPPGSIVQLKSGEVAMVREAVHNPADARVWTIYTAKRMPVLDPLPRYTAKPGHEIVGLAHYGDCRSAHLVIKSLWLKGT